MEPAAPEDEKHGASQCGAEQTHCVDGDNSKQRRLLCLALEAGQSGGVAGQHVAPGMAQMKVIPQL